MESGRLRERLLKVKEVLDRMTEFLNQEERIPGDAFAFSLAFCLQLFYQAIEEFLCEVAMVKDLPVPSGPRWHQNLVDMLGTQGMGFFDEQQMEAILPYLKFRHRARYAGLFLDRAEIRRLAAGAGHVYSILEHAVQPLTTGKKTE